MLIWFRMAGRIHRLVIHHDGDEYRWGVDKDYTNYTFLCTNICQDVLGGDYGVWTISLTIYGLVKGHENSFIVKDDASWMSLLGKNFNNEENMIHLFVNVEGVITSEVSPPRVGRCGPSCTITEIDEDADKDVKTGDAIVRYVGDEETNLMKTIIISDSESDDYLVRIFFFFSSQHSKGLDVLHVYKDRNRCSSCICMDESVAKLIHH